jgi:hypothetical protein
MTMSLGDFNAKAGRESILNSTKKNGSSHKICNYNGVLEQ